MPSRPLSFLDSSNNTDPSINSAPSINNDPSINIAPSINKDPSNNNDPSINNDLFPQNTLIQKFSTLDDGKIESPEEAIEYFLRLQFAKEVLVNLKKWINQKYPHLSSFLKMMNNLKQFFMVTTFT